MGARPAGMSAELNTIRTLVSMHTRKLWVMTVFIILTPVLGLAKLQHAMELLPIVGTLASTSGAVPLQRVNRALRNVVCNRLLGYP